MATHLLGTREARGSLCIPGVPVFVFHGLADRNSAPLAGLPTRERKYTSREDQFRDQLLAIKRHGGTITSLKHLADDRWSLHSATPIGITFDDGCSSDYEIAYPQLLASGAQAEFFINTATVGTPGRLSWSQIREMHANGMSIQSHGHHHCYLTHLAEHELRQELEVSKRTIEDHLGAEVDFLAVPYGDFNRRVLRVARESGYGAVCTSRNWPARPNRYTINRTAVYGSTALHEFESLLARDAIWYGRRAARAAAISVPKYVWLELRRRGILSAPGAGTLS